jgi:hypothetical protein
MKHSAIPFAIVASMIWVGPAHAQATPPGPHTFLAAHVGPKWDDLYSDSRIKKPVVEGGLSLGMDWASAGVEVDVGMSQWHVRQSPPQRFRYGGTTSGYMQKDHTYESLSTDRRRSPQVSLLFRKHRAVSDTVTVTGLIGGAFAYRPSNYSYILNEVLPDGTLVEVHRQEGQSTRNYFAAVAGVEVTVRLSRHWAIVPRLRFTGFPNLMDESAHAPRHLVIRPQVAVRWTF